MSVSKEEVGLDEKTCPDLRYIWVSEPVTGSLAVVNEVEVIAEDVGMSRGGDCQRVAGGAEKLKLEENSVAQEEEVDEVEGDGDEVERSLKVHMGDRGLIEKGEALLPVQETSKVVEVSAEVDGKGTSCALRVRMEDLSAEESTIDEPEAAQKKLDIDPISNSHDVDIPASDHKVSTDLHLPSDIVGSEAPRAIAPPIVSSLPTTFYHPPSPAMDDHNEAQTPHEPMHTNATQSVLPTTISTSPIPGLSEETSAGRQLGPTGSIDAYTEEMLEEIKLSKSKRDVAPEKTPKPTPPSITSPQGAPKISPSPIPSPSLPRPTFSSSASPAPMLSRSLKRKDTLEDLFSAMVPLKRKKVELVPKRIDTYRPDSPPIAIPTTTTDPADNLPAEEENGEAFIDDAPYEAPPSDDELEPICDAQRGQWRVGRLPGHQGSHIRRQEFGSENVVAEGSGSRGQKRSLGQSITDSAEKVLKKPFRLPARVILKSAPRPAPQRSISPALATPSPPSKSGSSSMAPSSPLKSKSSATSATIASVVKSSRPFAVPRKIAKPVFSELFPQTKPYTPAGTSSTLTPSSPVSASSTSLSTSPTLSSPFKPSPTFSKKLSKPFKTPFSRSAAPSPISTTASSSRARAKNSRDQLIELEKEERTLRNAIKYHTQPEEDERLVELIHIWRDAGQQVAELLFAIQPKPEAGVGVAGNGAGNGAFSFFGNDNDHGQQSFFPSVEYTPEQLRHIARLRTNADGEPIDDEGNPFFGSGGDVESSVKQDDMDEVGGVMDREDGIVKSAESDEWTIGTMLAKMGVEPSMYAWDADAEDWGIPEED